MKNTSLCYIERGGQYLMLHRVKKENDENREETFEDYVRFGKEMGIERVRKKAQFVPSFRFYLYLCHT